MVTCRAVEIFVSALVNVVQVRSLANDSFTNILDGGCIYFSNVFILFIATVKVSVIVLTLLLLSMLSFALFFQLAVVQLFLCHSFNLTTMMYCSFLHLVVCSVDSISWKILFVCPYAASFCNDLFLQAVLLLLCYIILLLFLCTLLVLK